MYAWGCSKSPYTAKATWGQETGPVDEETLPIPNELARAVHHAGRPPRLVPDSVAGTTAPRAPDRAHGVDQRQSWSRSRITYSPSLWRSVPQRLP